MAVTEPDDRIADPDDVTSVVVTAVAAVPPEQVWHVVVDRTAEWWGPPYLVPDAPGMRLEAELGGRVWSGAADGSEGDQHGTVRAVVPPERLEIGGVLVPGGYAGSITITLARSRLGTELRVEQLARGRVDAATEERLSSGWAHLLATLTALADE